MIALSRIPTVQSSVFVDGPNIDGVLGQILRCCPKSHQRPRWNRVKDYLGRILPFSGKPCFVTDKRYFTDKVSPLYRALHSMGYDVRTVDKVGGYIDNDDPVDEFILDQLHAILDRVRDGAELNVAVVSHDHIYASVLKEISEAGGRIVIVGFREWLHPDLLSLEGENCEIHDLEHDVCAFNSPLHKRPYRPY